MSKRNPAVLGIWGPNGTRVVASEAMWREPLKWDREAREAGERRRVFCASLADAFEFRADLIGPRSRLFRLILATPGLDWLLLTKRPEAAASILRDQVFIESDHGRERVSAWEAMKAGVFSNVWIGTSVEDQQRADERIPALLATPAAVRFLSVEPLLGPVDLSPWLGTWDDSGEIRPGIDWVIVGGESGHNARPCHLDWIRSIRDQCRSAGTALFVKQLGANPIDQLRADSPTHYVSIKDHKGGDPDEWPEDMRIREFPKAR